MNYLEQVIQPQENYYSECLDFARIWLINQKAPFTSEDIIRDYNESNLNKPSEPRVWGAVVKKLKDEKLIDFIQYVKYENKRGHGKPASQWKKITLRETCVIKE